MTNKQRFLNACHMKPVDRPPIWLMRQAGRYLPEYQALRKRSSFVKLVKTPGLASEITLQPIRRFDFDAAIIFSDILVIPSALGQDYSFADGKLKMEFALDPQKDLKKLRSGDIANNLSYVYEAISRTKSKLKGKHALIGFAGSPWTLANYMIEGASVKTFGKALKLLRYQKHALKPLLQILTRAIIAHLNQQIKAGADAIQIFDTLGGILPKQLFYHASGLWINKIISGLNKKVPVIVFAKGVNNDWKTLAGTGADIISIDSSIRLSTARKHLPGSIGLQGNLNPNTLESSVKTAEKETSRIIKEMHGQKGFIFNLGHGVTPRAKLANISKVVRTVKSSKWS
ncbi:uroporphyrinogen decarboxylase [Elusimicrobiota bacterium]